ncbi:MAG TPA: FHA domain-containing protein [Phycisphaerales bacterium]|nr:FHA domain-containing protein [Phycisphaerales bacterium]
MRVALVKIEADGSQREFPIPRLPVVVGRDEGSGVRLAAASVSRRHCEFREIDEELVVRDLGSSNGTYINGDRVKSKELSPGDVLAVGPFVFVVRIDGQPKGIDATESYALGAVPVGGGSGGSGAGAGAEPGHIAGVPTWGGQKPGGAAGQAGAGKEAGSAGAAGPGSGAAPKAGDKEGEDDLDSLLKDFDFGDLEDDEA